MLSDEWFIAAPRVWDSPATDISRSWRLTTSTDDDDRDQEGRDQGPPARRGQRGVQQEEEGHRQRRPEERAEDGPVGQRPGDPGAGHHAEPEGQQEDRHGPLREATDLGDDLGDVGVQGEHPAEADRAGQQRQPGLRRGEQPELSAAGGVGVAGTGRQEGRHEGRGQQGQSGGHPEGGTPADGLSEPGGNRDAEDVGHRQADHDRRHRSPFAPAGREARRHQRRDAEEGAVGDAAQEA